LGVSWEPHGETVARMAGIGSREETAQMAPPGRKPGGTPRAISYSESTRQLSQKSNERLSFVTHAPTPSSVHASFHSRSPAPRRNDSVRHAINEPAGRATAGSVRFPSARYVCVSTGYCTPRSLHVGFWGEARDVRSPRLSSVVRMHTHACTAHALWTGKRRARPQLCLSPPTKTLTLL